MQGLKTEKKFKVEHKRVKRNWAHGHGIGLVVTERVISQGRLAEIQDLQIEYTDARNRRHLKSVRDDLREGLLVKKGPFESHMR
jgi:hypothetical protein